MYVPPTLIVLFWNSLANSLFRTIPIISLADSWADISTSQVNMRCKRWKMNKTFHYKCLQYTRIRNLKQQNRCLSVITVCRYFSILLVRSFTCLYFPSKSNSYHNTSLSMSFGCWHLSGIPLCPLHFTVIPRYFYFDLYNSVTEEIRTAIYAV